MASQAVSVGSKPTKVKKMRKVTVGQVIGKIIIVFIILICVYPIIWLIINSFKTTADFNVTPSYSLPRSLYLLNYETAWVTGRVSTFFKNSAISTIVSLLFIVFFSSCASFGLTKLRWRFSGLVYNIFSFGIMVPTAVVLIPLFYMYKSMHLTNNLWSLIITYSAFGLSLSIFIMTSYLKALPNELIEAAVIDGCNIYQAFARVVFPLMKTSVITVLVLQFYLRWNDLLFSMTFISDTSLKTLQTGLLYFSTMYSGTNWGAVFASITITITPTIIIYFCLNKFVIEGMTAGAVKG